MIKTYQKDQIQIIELNRPKVNAINEELIKSLDLQIESLKNDDTIKGIIYLFISTPNY